MEAGSGDREGGRAAGELGPLPGGHHGLTREQILDSQRERLLASVAHEVARVGYRATTITGIVKLASVSTRDFYEIFDSKEECFLTAFDVVRDHIATLIEDAAALEPDWPRQIVAAARAVLEFFATEPDLARLCLVEAVTATPASSIRFREAVLAGAPAVARGRAQLADPDSLIPEIESSIVGGAVSLAARCVAAGEVERLPGLLPGLAEFILSPYLGDERAAEMAARSQLG